MVVIVDVLIDACNAFAQAVTSIYVPGFHVELPVKRFVIPILPRCPVRTHGQLGTEGRDQTHDIGTIVRRAVISMHTVGRTIRVQRILFFDSSA
jgi:hypothetical protein